MDTRSRVSPLIAFIFAVFVAVIGLSGSSYAIPAFARQYGTSCSTCHIDFPKLNDFGKAFKDAGFKFPKDDETFIKVPPVMLGAMAAILPALMATSRTASMPTEGSMTRPPLMINS